MNNFRYNLIYLMSVEELSVKEFAEKISVSKSSVYSWLSDFNMPRPENVRKIIRYFNIDFNDLFFEQLWKRK